MNASERMRGETLRRKWTALLADEGTDQLLLDVREELLTKRLQRVSSIDCPRCRGSRKVDVELEVYRLPDILAFLRFLAEYGIGKPVEQQEVRVLHDFSGPLRELPDEALRELASGDVVDADYEEIPA